MTIEVYQPQLEQWSDNKLEAYAAVTIKSQGPSDKSYGVIWFTARTEVDKVNRLVTLDGIRLTRPCFPSFVENGLEYLEALQANNVLDVGHPSGSARNLIGGDERCGQPEEVPTARMRSLTSSSATKAAFLVLIDGDPVFWTVDQNLQMVTNTQALILFDREADVLPGSYGRLVCRLPPTLDNGPWPSMYR